MKPEAFTFKHSMIYPKLTNTTFRQESSPNGASVISTQKFEGYHATTDDDREMK
jgi:hypothetical protein